MKKIAALIILCFATICSYAQTYFPISEEYDSTFYRCDRLTKDIKYYNHFYKNFRGDFVKWADAVKNVFPNDKNNNLHYTYILSTNSTFDKNHVMKICADWYNSFFGCSKYYFIEKTDNCIKGKGAFEYISQIKGASVHDVNNTFLDVVMHFKDNRIKFEIIGHHYMYIKAGVSAEYFIPGKVAPFEEEYDVFKKIIFSESYIRFCDNSINLARSFIDYLNKNINLPVTEEDAW